MGKATLIVLLLPLIAVGACEPTAKILGLPEHTPEIHRIVPDFGSLDGGETVTIHGEDFGDDPEVSFGGAPATVVHRSAEELQVETPAGAGGPIEISVENRGGKIGRLTDGFTYQDPLLSPHLTAVTPATGFVGGGTPVTLMGTQFQDGASVYFEGLLADQIVVECDTRITAVTPAGMPQGAIDVLLENPDNRKAILPDAFVTSGLTEDEYNVLLLVNQERAARGLDPLVANGILTQAARDHSQDMIDRDFFDHVNPDGLAPWDRAMALGYPSSFVGENIAAGYATPQAVMDAWMNSPGHRANILDPNFTEIGIGRRDGGSMGAYWTQVFGAP
ncbi:MAG: IPT/TIG domain-containing protein [Planctomycetota bacterium]|jgi:uncharacterized protein YkwD